MAVDKYMEGVNLLAQAQATIDSAFTPMTMLHDASVGDPDMLEVP